MSDTTFQMVALAIYFLGMLAIGFWALSRTKSLDDFMLADRGLGPAVSALSAGASDMSGWLLMGLPGALYATGMVEAWIAVGLTVGAWVNWKVVAPRLRSYTEVAENSITVPSFLENRLKDRSRVLRVASGLIILLFFTFYVSSGMVAGGVFFESSFDSSYHLGLVLVAAITVAYTLFGGFLAVSYTDFVQGLIMLLALVAVPVVGVIEVGGVGATIDGVRAVDPAHFSMLEGATFLGVVSALAWGLGYFGQPHIIVRFMALRTPAEATEARRIGMGWMVISLAGAVCTAMVGLAWYHQNGRTLDDPESVFIEMGQILFHPLIAGIVLAAVLAAIMSTVSSQLLVTSSALVEDLFKVVVRSTPSTTALVALSRTAVVVIALVAGALAWEQSDTILGLVAYAWAGFGGSFGPVILLALYWRRLTVPGALAGLVVGAVTVVVWGNVDALAGTLYEIVPGFVLNLLAAVVVSLLTYRPNAEIEDEFDRSVAAARG